MPGCGREFFRNWADQDVSEAVFEKTRDPRWTIEKFTIEPPSLARYADPYDPDRPPAPPDDRAAEALSPVPQWPHHRLLVPQEGTGYLKMLEFWQSQRPPAGPTETPATPPPAADGGSPFGTGPGPNETNDPVSPGPGVAPPSATPTPPPPLDPAPTTENGDEKSGATPPRLTPTPSTGAARTTTPVPSPSSARPTPSLVSAPVATGRPASNQDKKDSVVLQAALQVPDTATTPGDPLSPGRPPLVPPGLEAGLDPNPNIGLGPAATDPNVPVDVKNPPRVRSGLSPEQEIPAARATAGLAGLLAGTAEAIPDYEAAALPKGQPIYLVNPAQALTLALTNNRGYQGSIEQVYLRSLDVTLQRFNFEPQVAAGLTPSTGRGIVAPNNANSFIYRTREAPGGQQSVLNIGTLVGVGKLTSFGASIATGFANQVVFNFIGNNPRRPTVQSTLPLQIVLPFLRGGGRAVTLENLTQAERNLLYEVRNFARYRQQFVPYVLTSGQGAAGTLAGAGGGIAGGNEPATGFLQVLQQLQQLENSRKTVAAFEALARAYGEMGRGAGSGVSALNVDQINLSLQSNRSQLVGQTNNFRNTLDQFKIQLGLPPDTPLMVDRGLLAGFRRAFDDIDEWFLEEKRDPADLPGYVNRLPELEDVVVDGRRVVDLGRDPQKLEDVLNDASRVALENRFDLMNARGQLYDAWRQLAVTFNGVKGIFNVNITNQVFTPPGVTNPLGFWDQSKQFALTLNTELPLVRVNERNLYRTALIRYRQQQRALMLLEDSIKLAIRTDVRALVLQSEVYNIQKGNLVISLRQKDNSQRLIFAPPGPGDSGGSQQITANTQTLVQAQNSFLSSQNTLISTWVNYQTARLSLYRDLGIIPYDEWEAFYELFPAQPAGDDAGADRDGARAAAAGAPSGPAEGRS
jgi:hypothetical protein